MGIVDKAIWYVETHLGQPLTLAHMARDLATLTGVPLIRYVWKRRLTRAVEALVAGEASVLTLALDAGYQSAEAFSRAFKAEFGLTPRQLRQKGTLTGLSLTQPMEFPKVTDRILAAPKIEDMPARNFAGPVVRYDMTTRAKIPAQWEAYNRDGIRVPAIGPRDYYALVANFNEQAGSFDYLCGQEVAADTPLPEGFKRLSVPAGKWARFSTRGHISTMQAVWTEVMNTWMGQPGLEARRGTSIEYYPPEFNGMTGQGGYELWVPVA